MIERYHLSILRELNRQGSLAAAAGALNLTQSALSHAIRKLEHQYDLQVWERSGRKVRLTQAGEYLLGMANTLLPVLEQADQTLRSFSEGKKGKLRIGMECHPCYEWLMGVVAPFLVRWPDVDLDVIQQFRFDGLGALLNHKVDLLITSDPIENPALQYEPVLDYELMLVVPTHHPVAKARYVKARALLEENLISFPVEKARLDIFTRFLIPAAVEPKTLQSVETIEVMLQLVASGRGVCTLPDWLLEKYRESYPIRGVRLGEEGVDKTLYLVFRREDEEKAYLKDFIHLGRNGG